jgi:hypothetical protein
VHGFLLYAVFRYAMPSAGLWPWLAVVTLVETAREVAENTDAVIQRYREATVALEFELGIGWRIGDNLTLNALALLWPLEAVRAWQSGT